MNEIIFKAMESFNFMEVVAVGALLFWVYSKCDAKFNVIEKKFDRVEKRLYNIERKVDAVDRRLCRLEGKLSSGNFSTQTQRIINASEQSI